MKRLIILFCCLLAAFGGLWAVKAKSPEERPDAYAYGVDEKAGAWWLRTEEMPVVDQEWQLDPEIPLNYIPVLGEEELYMVIGENGQIEGYRHRIKQDDGSWLWEDVNPDIPEHYEPVEGFEDVYKVTNEDGSIQYFRYIRNEDDTFCFVEVDENGNEINNDVPDGMTIPDNYHRIQGNIYAVLNENGVIIGYMERVLSDDGAYQWIICDNPEKMNNQQQPQITESIGLNNDDAPTGNGEQKDNGITIITPSISQEQISGGGYTETETIADRKTSGGWSVTYQTVITRTYDAQGKLISTKKDGPTEISKTQSITGAEQTAPDPGAIKSSLVEEYGRITSGLTFKRDMAEEVLAQLNAERSASGLVPLKMTEGSDVYQIAAIKAADMALYNHSDYDSPLYGDISSLLNRYGISSAGPSETLWKATAAKTAKDIHIRFQAQEYSRSARMDERHSSVGIAVVEKNGYLYIAEIYI